jgi:hypothetical protein
VSFTPRFTAKSPDPSDVIGYYRIYRCTTVEACDSELRELVARMGRTSHPEVTAGIHADIDEVLERRLALGARGSGPHGSPLRLAREA